MTQGNENAGGNRSWSRKASCRMDAWQAARAGWKSDMERFKADQRTARETGVPVENPGPPPTGFSLLPWLLMGMGAFSNIFQAGTPQPWLGALGLLTFNSLYIYVVFRAFVKDKREARSTRVALVLMGAVTCALAIGYGGNWLYFFPLLGLATGAVTRGPWLGRTGLGLTALAVAVSAVQDGWDAVNIGYATFLSTMVTAAILSLSEAVRELRAAREELARRAVEKERLRFSRDLHDLLGHTLSVIVVKSEAARRLAPRDMDAALAQITDIESVGRQALTEIREAVTGYREGSLTTELDRARSALEAAAITPAVHHTGPPLTADTETLLSWVVREAVTNAVRHSGASRCEISVEGAVGRVRVRVVDDGRGVVGGVGGAGSGVSAAGSVDRVGSVSAGEAVNGVEVVAAGDAVRGVRAEGAGDAVGAVSGARARGAVGAMGSPGTGLKGLAERLAAAGGRLEAGPGPRGGFVVTAELPVEVLERDGAVVG